MMNNNNVVKLNDAEMEKVNGGYQQNDINLLISSPTHIGKRSQEESDARA